MQLRGGRRLVACPFRDFSRKQKTVPWNRPNERLLLATLADGAPRGIDAAIQSRIGDDPSLPDVFDQFVLADHAVGVLSEIKKEVEDLRLDMDGAAGAFELAPVGIKRKIIEIYQQLRSLAVSRRILWFLREITGKSKAKNRRV